MKRKEKYGIIKHVMDNILAVDYGKKRWGLAFCDELRVVFTLPAATQDDFKDRVAYLLRVMKERRITQVVMGLPLTLKGDRTAWTEEVEKFAREFIEPTGVKVDWVDEAMSSVEAAAKQPRRKIKQGRAPRDGTLDSAAAAIILEEWLGAALG